jgi:hypothetical protein
MPVLRRLWDEAGLNDIISGAAKKVGEFSESMKGEPKPYGGMPPPREKTSKDYEPPPPRPNFGTGVTGKADGGGPFDVNGVDLLFDDYAPAPLPADAQIVAGTWQPTDIVSIDSDVFPAPAPPGPYGTNLNAFDGTDPQGTWQLYVNDDAGGDIGSAMQWCLDIYPTFPTGEVTNVHWKDKTTMEWDAPANAWGYSIRRGTAADMGKLLTAEIDSCNGVGTYAQTVQAPSVPAPGTLQWYLVLGANGAGFPTGTAGTARVAGAEMGRVLDSSAGCNAPF